MGLRPKPRQRTSSFGNLFILNHLPQRKMIDKEQKGVQRTQSFGGVWGGAPLDEEYKKFMARFAVVCAAGIGDALILEITSHYLRLQGHKVVTFSDHLSQFGKWLPKAVCRNQPKVEEIKETFEEFDAVIVQHDNTEKARAILRLRPEKQVYTFYTNYRLSKHGPLCSKNDVVFDEKVTMVANVKEALSKLFGIDARGGENGLQAPENLEYRKYKRRIAIHPTSTMSWKNWSKGKFLQVAKLLKKEDYDPVFITSPKERAEWGAVELASLSDLASFLYESGSFLGNDSGPGHLASYFKLPHLIIGRQERQMKLWRPGWRLGEIVTAPSWIPNWKSWRIRDEKWQMFISSRKVIKELKSKVLDN
jgi:heptosyltransferase-3